MVEQTLEFQVGRGGNTVRLTPQQEQEARRLAQNVLRGGSSVSISEATATSRQKPIFRRARFIVNEAERKNFILQRDAAEQRLQVQQSKQEKQTVNPELQQSRINQEGTSSIFNLPPKDQFVSNLLSGSAPIDRRTSRQGVSSFIESERAKDLFNKLETGQRVSSTLGLGESSIISSLIQNVKEEAGAKSQSQVAPSVSEIQSVTRSRDFLEFVGIRKDESKISEEDAVFASSRSLGQFKQSVTRKEFDRQLKDIRKEEEARLDVNIYQQRIDAGEDFETVKADYNAEIERANMRIENFAEEFPEKFQKEKGRFIDKAITKQLRRVEGLEESKKTIRGISGNLLRGGAFGFGGAAFGKGVSLVSPTASGVLGKVGGGAGVVLSSANLGIGGGEGLERFRILKSEGFDTPEALQLSLLRGANVAAPGAFTGAGAIAGSFAFSGVSKIGSNLLKTGSVRGITSKESKLIERALKKPGTVEPKLVKGSTNVEKIRGIGQEKGTVSGVKTSRTFELRVDSTGLDKPTQRAFGKLNLRGFTFQDSQILNGKASILESSFVRTGKILPISKQFIISSGQGTAKGGLLNLNKFSLSKTIGQPFTTFTGEKIIGQGRATEIFPFRFETGKALSQQLVRGTISPTGEIRSLISSQRITGSKTNIFSIFSGAEITGTPTQPGGGVVGGSVSFQDLAGGIRSSRFTPSTFAPPKSTGGFPKTPFSSTFGTTSTGQSLLSQQTTQLSFVPTPSLSITSTPTVTTSQLNVLGTAAISIPQLNTDLRTRTRTRTTTTVTSRTGISPRTLLRSRTKKDTETVFRLGTPTGLSTGLGTGLSPSQPQSPRQRQPLIPKPIQRPAQPSPVFPSSPTGVDFVFDFNVRPPTPVPPPFLPKLKVGRSKRSQGRGQPTRLTPSLTGSAFNIKGRGVELGIDFGTSPFRIRGIDENLFDLPKKKKKKKKKRRVDILGF